MQLRIRENTALLVFSTACALGAATAHAADPQACELYPIGISSQCFQGIPVGGTVNNIPLGKKAGQFTWLTWTGRPHWRELVVSLTPPGNGQEFINPQDPNDHSLSQADWVTARRGTFNQKEVRRALTRLIGRDIVVPVWDQELQNRVRVSSFAHVRLNGYDLRGGDKISVTFLGYLTCQGSGSLPVAIPQFVSTDQGVPVSITLIGFDPAGAALTFAIVTQPAHGALSGTPPLVTYTPSSGFHGEDSFTFRVTSTSGQTAAAEVTIEVLGPGTAIIASGTYRLFNHPAGTTSPPYSGLRLDELLNSTAGHDDLTFDFEAPGTAVFLRYNSDDRTIHIFGHVYGGVDTGTVYSPQSAGYWEIDFNYGTANLATIGPDDGDDLQVLGTGNPKGGGITRLDTALSYDLFEKATSGYSFQLGDEDGNGHAGYDGISGWGWLNHTSGTVHVDVSEWLFTLDPFPVDENQPPVLAADTATTLRDVALSIPFGQLLANDSDPDGDTLTLIAAGNARNGALVLDRAGGTITFTPAAGFVGAASFEYTVSDGQGGVVDSSVAVTVVRPNALPVAVADAATTFKGTSVTVAVLANDSDGDGDALGIASFTQPTHGAAAVNAGGTVTYTPASGFAGLDEFSYTVSDGYGGQATATVALSVLNRTPAADARSATTDEDHSVGITLGGSDPDGDAITFAVAAQPAHGTLSGAPPALTYTPAANFNGSDSFSYTASDGAATSTRATVSITVRPVDDPPVAEAQSVTTDEDTPVKITLAVSEPDGDVLDFTFTAAPSLGVLSGVPPEMYFVPNRDASGADSFRYYLTDGHTTTPQVTVSITIRPVNDRPTAVPLMLRTNQDTAVAVTLAGADAEGGALTFAAASPAHGSLSGTPPSLTYAPAPGFSGSDGFTYTASDGSLTSDPATVTIAVNASPAVTLTSPTAGKRFKPGTSISLAANASDAGGSVARVEFFAGAQKLGEDATAPYALAWSGAPAGAHVLTARAVDDLGAAAISPPVTVSVEEFNEPPVVDAGANQTIGPFNATGLAGSVTDDGLPAGGSMTCLWRKVSGPGSVAFANPAIASTTGTFGAGGVYLLELSASDSELSSSAVVEITVNLENEPPLVRAGEDQAVSLDTGASLRGTAIDDGLPAGSVLALSWSRVDGPGTAAFASPSGLATQVSFSAPGAYRLRLTASDGQLSGSDEVAVTVSADPFRRGSYTLDGDFDSGVLTGVGHQVPDQLQLLDGITDGNWAVVFDSGLEGADWGLVTWNARVCGGATVAVSVQTSADGVTFTPLSSVERMVDLDVATGRYLRVEVRFQREPGGRSPVLYDLIAGTLGAPLPAAVNAAPDAVAGSDSSIAWPGTAQLSGSACDDGLPEGAPAAFSWRQLEGPGTASFSDPASPASTVSFSAPGIYLLELTASDSELEGSDTVTVSAIQGNQPPAVEAGPDLGARQAGAAVTLSGSASDDGLPLGQTLAVNWKKLGGPGTVSFANPASASTSATFSADGIYFLELTASDSQFSARDTVTVRVGTPCGVVLPAGAAAWWPGNGSLDEVVSGLVTTKIGTVNFESAEVSEGFAFPSGSGVLKTPANPAITFSTGSGSFSAECWLRPDVSQNNRTFLGWYRAGDFAAGVVLFLENGGVANGPMNLRWAIPYPTGGSFQFRSSAALLPGVYQHVALTYDKTSGIARFYRNAEIIGEVVIAGVVLPTSYDFYLGGHPQTVSGRLFGAIDEAALYSRALKPDEVMAIYSAGSAGKCAGAENSAPFVEAGAGLSLSVPGSATLEGFASDDGLPAGAGLRYQWTPLSGPSTASLSDSQALVTAATFNAAGIYVVELAADDSLLRSRDLLTVRAGAPCGVETPQGLLAWWPGNRSYDDLTGAHPAEDQSGVAFTAAKVSEGFLFQQASDALRIPASTALDPTLKAGLTIEFWARADSLSTRTVLGWFDGPSFDPGFKLSLQRPGATSKLDLRVDLRTPTGAFSSLTAGQVVEVGVLQHMVFSLDTASRRGRIYLNGKIMVEGTMGSLRSLATHDFYLGREPGGPSYLSFIGILDEISIYGRELTMSEVEGLFAAGAAGKCLPPPNQAPVVDAGGDLSVRSGVPVHLAGTVEDDGLPLGSSLNIAWTKLSGPGDVSFTSPQSAASDATFSADGIYILELRADDSLLSASDRVTVRVGSPCGTQAPADLLAWWPGNRSGEDLAGGNPGELQGAVGFIPAEVSDGFDFHGGYDSLKVTASPELDLSTLPGFTIECWVRPDVLGSKTLIGWFRQSDYGGSLVLTLHYEGGSTMDLFVNLKLGNGLFFQSTTAFTTGTLQHLAFSFDKATSRARAYRNGKLLTQATTVSLPSLAAHDVYLGRTPGSNNNATFDGTIDELTLYRRELYPDEVAAVHAAGTGGKCRVGGNEPPVVDAGSDVSMASLSPVSLAGFAADDGRPAGPGLAVKWSLSNGPGTVGFTDQTLPATTATFSAAGTYVLSLAADDGEFVSRDAVTVQVGVACPASPSGLVSYWPGNGSAEDALGRNHGQLLSTTSYVAAKVSQGFKFSSAHEGVLVPGSSELSFELRDGLTIEFWLRPDAAGSQPLVEWIRTADSVFGAFLKLQNTTSPMALNADLIDTNGTHHSITSTSVITTGTFQHLALTYDRATGQAAMYRNGAVIKQQAVGSFMLQTEYDLFFGYEPKAFGGLGVAPLFLNGVLDEVAIYNRALSAAEIQAIQASGAGRCPVADDRLPYLDAGADQTVSLGTLVLLDGTVRDDGAGSGGLALRWTLVSGPAAARIASPTGADTAVELPQVGAYVFELTASDGTSSASDRVTVTVTPSGLHNSAPAVDAGADLTVPLVPGAQLAGTASDDGAPPGSVLAVRWRKLSGPGIVSFEGTREESLTPRARFSAPGAYVLELSATDGELSAADQVTITVEDPGNPGLPDLAAVSLDRSLVAIDGQSLSVGGTASAVVENRGDVPAGAISVIFFEDRNSNGTFEPETDGLLGDTSLGGLAAGVTATASASLSGTLRFRGSPLYVLADGTYAVAESDETNNLLGSASGCSFSSTGSWTPVQEWSWTASAVLSSSLDVEAPPLVADLDGDGAPEVVFGTSSFPEGGALLVGALRALRGRDGSEVFTVTDPALRISASFTPAAADLDGDGLPEIVACDSTGTRLLAFAHDGSFLWRSPELEGDVHFGSAAIADLDGDGAPEIVVGRQALSAAGGILWTGGGGQGIQNERGPFSLVADLDLDGSPEVVAGNTAYSATGGVKWQAPLPDGYDAVADFDGDQFAEVVLVSGGQVWLLDQDGAVLWGPVTLPGGGIGGPPLVADLDGDGEPEIGVGAATRYTVLESDGSQKWSSPIQDPSSSRNGSIAFDFEGDGRAEVLSSDETKLRIFRGTDGAVLYETGLSSCTWAEYPVVADVDGDGRAEVVAGANKICDKGPQRGIRVFGEAQGRWAPARPIWNQYAYHVTNVSDRGAIPASEEAGWLAGQNGYRESRLQGGARGAADVTASKLTLSVVGSSLYLSALIGNGGSYLAGAGLKVTFYDGDPAAGGSLIGTASTQKVLVPGAVEEVRLLLPSGFNVVNRTIHVVADDSGGLTGTLGECDESNNRHSAVVASGSLPRVPNAPPAAAFIMTQSGVNPGDTWSFDASGTADPESDPVTLHWDFGDGAEGEGTAVTHTYTRSGDFTVTLRARDSLGAEGTATRALEVNSLPGFTFLPNAVIRAGTLFRFTVPVVDGDGDAPVLALITAPSGLALDSPSRVITWTPGDAQTGLHQVTLRASDGKGSADGSFTLFVVGSAGAPANLAPVVSAGEDQRIALSESAELTGSIHDDGLPAGSVVTYVWSMVSGPGTATFANGSTLSPTVSFSAVGFYVVRLRATDGVLSASDEVEITVEPENIAPRVSAGADFAVSISTGATLAGSVLDDGRPGGGALTCAWSKVTGPGTVTFGAGSSPTSSAAFSAAGAYLLRLTASDGELTSSDEVAVTVYPYDAANQPPVVNAGADRSVPVNQNLVLSATASDDGRPAGTLAYRWRALSGPGAVVFSAPEGQDRRPRREPPSPSRSREHPSPRDCPSVMKTRLFSIQHSLHRGDGQGDQDTDPGQAAVGYVGDRHG